MFKKVLNLITGGSKLKNKKTTLPGIMAILGAMVAAYDQGGVDALVCALVATGLGLIFGRDGGV
ncbi:hypothetical protein LCGC14_1086420 [marine sediment metagenome]|uniref:Uncharacterized protein n=1 Tax=marine sediment metagenome TaxID=412755 RepID=A0A0F9MI07_9ZZZZ